MCKFTDDVACIPSVIVVLLICSSQTVASCKLGQCIGALSCPVVRPAVTLHMQNNSSQVIDVIKQHRCGDRESRSVCCTDLAADLVRHNILANFTDENSTIALAKLMTNICGISSQSDLILNGRSAFLYEFPWMALLEYNTSTGAEGNSSFLCGGSLINDRYVLTAAHCFISKDSRLTNVRLGEYDTSKELDCEGFGDDEDDCAPPVQNHQVEDVIIHKDFKRALFSNDIALIRLRERVVYGDRILPICLPVFNDLIQDITHAQVAGWGLTARGTAADILQKARLPVLSNDFCGELFARNLSPGHICAGGNRGEDTCRGDSGGPLFIRSRSNFYDFVQYGILSGGGVVCGGNNTVPSIYTNVASFMPWILQNIKP